MKKENKQRKLEEQQQERDRRFKRQGNICMGVIVGCFLVMLIVGRQCAGASWLGVEPASIAKTLLDGPFCDSQSNAGNIDSVLQT